MYYMVLYGHKGMDVKIKGQIVIGSISGLVKRHKRHSANIPGDSYGFKPESLRINIDLSIEKGK